MIRFKDVSKVFQLKDSQLKAVNNVNLTIDDGDIFGIIGYSGAGKSTLVRMLNGLETPTSGSVEINGHDIAKLHGKELRDQQKQIGMIFQHFNLLWSRTIIENLMLPLELARIDKSTRVAKAKKLIELVGLKGRENDYPSELSGGQKQRVGIARALANDPKLLISDEATSALDPQTTDEILDLLVKINHDLGISIVLITHEMHAIRKVARNIAVMQDGSVVEKGSVSDIFNHPKQPITKRFVSENDAPNTKDTTMALDELVNRYPNGSIIKLTFNGKRSQSPVVSQVAKQRPDLEINIIEGALHPTQAGTIGTLVIQLLGDPAEQKKALEDFQTLKVETEVLSRG
ncbi:methionine ABC transporter ATP-binding protein [Nicoliella spurrieriana]|uniref:Methionine ABC transporter ATP-binding protein n=1 Tax=Nicoliella spurrieriana TaxID=2925830 RepID=A0A976RS69_9LACO|nr:methionine ABC transporter ATP-binding protein [Nicoliella spurrieriana]UQS86828.1 methionine ABC transporter ATP-binding protein [Nicoliella spurrieriana]